MEDCRRELHGLLQEEVRCAQQDAGRELTVSQRLAGASLLVFANKQDIAGSLTSAEIAEVRFPPLLPLFG